MGTEIHGLRLDPSNIPQNTVISSLCLQLVHDTQIENNLHDRFRSGWQHVYWHQNKSKCISHALYSPDLQQ